MNDSALFTDEPAPANADASLFTDEPAPKSVSGAVSNLGKDISGTVKAIPGMVKAVAGYPMDVMESGAMLTHGGKLADTPVAEDWKRVGSGIVNEGKRIGAGELLTGHPINAAEKFGNALYEKPLTTGLDVASLFGLKGPAAGAGEATAPAAEAAATAEPLAEAATKAAPADAVDIFAAPMKGYSAPLDEAVKQLSKPEYSEWKSRVDALPGVMESRPTAGVWEGSTEPSLHIKADPAQADIIAGKTGMGLGSSNPEFGVAQDGIGMSNRHSASPNGTHYEVKFNSPEAMKKWKEAATKYDIKGQTVNPGSNTLIFLDQGDKLFHNIDSFVNDAQKAGDIHGNGLSSYVSEIKFPGPADYPTLLQGGPRKIVGPAEEAGGATARGHIRPGNQPEEAAAPGVKPPPGIPPPGPTATPPPAAGIPFAKEAINKANEVKDYISRGYEGFAKKPGGIANVADYVQSKSQMMSLQQMGFTPGQIRNLGKTASEVHNAERAIGQYGIDSGIVSEMTGLKGMVERNAELLKAAGDKVGKFREAADQGAPAYQPGELVAAVKAKLDPIYQRGVTTETPTPRGLKGPDASSYRRALEELEDAPPSHKEAAEVATRLNQEATQATKMSQNPGPYTDVANAVSEINNERIKAKLGPEAGAQYEHALREFGVNKKIQNGLKYKSSGEVKRFGPGSFTSNMTQKAMDEFGYKLGAKVANRASSSILKNPAIAKNLPSLFKEFINQVEDVGHEITGMSEGGRVPAEVSAWMGGKMRKLIVAAFLVSVTSVCRADSLTPRLGLTLPTIGSPTWGQKINGNFQILDSTVTAGSIIAGATYYINNVAVTAGTTAFMVSSGTVIGNFYDLGLSTGQCVQTGAGGLFTVTGVPCASGSGLTSGASFYVWVTTGAVQPGAFLISSGTVQGIFTIQQPDNDTTDPPIAIRSLTTQEGAANMYHSAFLYARIPNPNVNNGEFIITVSSYDLNSSVGGLDRIQRPEIALISTNNVIGSPYIRLTPNGHQFPYTTLGAGGDFYALPGVDIIYQELDINSVPTSGISGRLVMSGSTSGTSRIQPPASGGNNIWTLPANTTGFIRADAGVMSVVSSVTVGGVLVGGTGITVAQGVGVTTITATGSGGGIVSPGTFTWTNSFGINVSTLVCTSTLTAQALIAGTTIQVARIQGQAGTNNRLDFLTGGSGSINMVTTGGQNTLFQIAAYFGGNFANNTVTGKTIGTMTPGGGDTEDLFEAKTTPVSQNLFPHAAYLASVNSDGLGVNTVYFGDQSVPGRDTYFFVAGGTNTGCGASCSYPNISSTTFVIDETYGSSSYGFIGVNIATPTANLHVNGTSIIGATNMVNANNIFQIGTSTTTAFLANGHIEYHQPTVPAETACGGGGPTIVAGSTDKAGAMTTGTAATGCTLTFGNSWTNAPFCTITDNSTATVGSINSISTTQLIVNLSVAAAGVNIYYHCDGFQ